jgi:hypothetical protein
MLMKMLHAGGVEIVSDDKRKPDRDNPKGYFEFEKVKDLKADNGWLSQCKGKAIKIISFLLYHLPSDLNYKVVFVRRNMDEILLSQKKMYERLQKQPDTVKDEVLKTKFDAHLEKIEKWMDRKKNIETLQVHYSHIVEDPSGGAEKIRRFINRPLNLAEMIEVVDPDLHRNRIGG